MPARRAPTARIALSLGLDVDIIPTSYDESPIAGRSPIETAVLHARGKVAGAPPSAYLTIGADTVVDLDGRVLGKPQNDAEARIMLSELSGRTHHVHTAFALREPSGGIAVVEAVSTQVRFAELDPDTIDAYVASGDGRDKAGSYGIQGFAATLVERIDGDYFTVVGFPLAAFAAAVGRLGLRLRPRRMTAPA